LTVKGEGRTDGGFQILGLVLFRGRFHVIVVGRRPQVEAVQM
jgi:hypothetical protein